MQCECETEMELVDDAVINFYDPREPDGHGQTEVDPFWSCDNCGHEEPYIKDDIED